jgi:hypothetical protein
VTQVLPTYAAALVVPTVAQEEAALLSSMGAATLPIGSTVPGSIAPASGVFTLAGHGLSNGDLVRFWAIGPGASVPQPLVSLTVYYAVGVTSSTFQVAQTSGGTPISLTPGSGLLYAAKVTNVSLLAGWSPDAPQRQLLSAEAQALQFEMIQRAALAYAASPSQVRQLRTFLTSQGYSAADAATITSAWVDVALEWYQSPRIPASQAVWQVPLVATSTQTIDNTSTIVLQAADGTFFVSSQASAATLNSGNSYKGAVAFQARQPGTSGNVPPGSILTVVQGPPGLAVDLSQAQTLVTPARNAETDEDALTRASGRWGTLAGVLTAAGWQYVLTSPEVGGVTSITRVFVDDANPFGEGSIGIALANGAGAANASEVAAAQAIAARVRIAGTGPVVVGAAAELDVPVTVQLKTDGTNPNAAAQATSKLLQFGPALAGNTLFLDDIVVVCRSIPGVVGDVVISLTADVQRPQGGVIVLQPTVTAT